MKKTVIIKAVRFYLMLLSLSRTSLVSSRQLAVAAGPQEVQGQMSAGKGTSV